MTFRFPTELVEEIVSRTQQTGKDKTAIVVETLTQAFGLPAPSPAPITIAALQQQLNYLQNTVADLSQQLAGYHQSHPFQLDDRSLHRISSLENIISSFQALSVDVVSEALINPQSPPILEGDSPDDPFAEERQGLLRQMEQQAKTLDQILSASPDVIYVIDKMERFTYVNLTCARVFGIERRDILGKTSQEIVGGGEFAS